MTTATNANWGTRGDSASHKPMPEKCHACILPASLNKLSPPGHGPGLADHLANWSILWEYSHVKYYE